MQSPNLWFLSSKKSWAVYTACVNGRSTAHLCIGITAELLRAKRTVVMLKKIWLTHQAKKIWLLRDGGMSARPYTFVTVLHYMCVDHSLMRPQYFVGEETKWCSIWFSKWNKCIGFKNAPPCNQSMHTWSCPVILHASFPLFALFFPSSLHVLQWRL